MKRACAAPAGERESVAPNDAQHALLLERLALVALGAGHQAHQLGVHLGHTKRAHGLSEGSARDLPLRCIALPAAAQPPAPQHCAQISP